MQNLLNNVSLRGPEDDNQGGGAASVWDAADPQADAALEASSQGKQSGQQQSGSGGESRESQQLTPSEGQQQQGQQQSPPPFNSAEFGTAMAQALREAGVVAQPQQQQVKEMTDEEFRKHTHYYSVTPEKVTLLCGEAPEALNDEQKNAWVAQRMAALQEMLDGTNKHALAVSRLASMNDVRQIQGQVAPLIAEREKAAFNNLLNEMAGSNTVLKSMSGGAGANIIYIALRSLQQENFRPANEQQARQAIYQRAEQLGRLSNPDFTLNLNNQGGGQGGGRAGGMTSSVNGAGGSGNSNNNGGSQKKASIAIYD